MTDTLKNIYQFCTIRQLFKQANRQAGKQEGKQEGRESGRQLGRRAACETADSPMVTASVPRPPMAAAASVKRKAKAGVTGRSQKRRRSVKSL